MRPVDGGGYDPSPATALPIAGTSDGNDCSRLENNQRATIQEGVFSWWLDPWSVA
jgi:hypothetical protein